MQTKMKLCHKISTLIFVLTIMMLSSTSFKSFGQESLIIKILNVQKNTGKVVIEIYTSKTSWLESPYKTMVLSTNQDVQTTSFQVPYGKYAISVYQDLNDNGEADMNFLGIPKELVGFGNNFKPFGEPKFESCLVEFSATSKPQEIKLCKVF
jgi:uncharacterized protein (DUF2141 family)